MKTCKLLSILTVLYFFISCASSPASPESDGIKAAKAFHDSDEQYMNNLVREFNDFVINFDDYHFVTRIEARQKVEELIEKEDREYAKNIEKAERQYLELKNKYIKNREDAISFESAYQQQRELDEADMLHGLPSQLLINEKILTIIPPKPTINKIKKDLVGREFKDKPDGYFSMNGQFFIANDEIQNIEILSTEDKNGFYKLNALITLQEKAGSIIYEVDADIIYLLGDADDWTISGFSANSIAVVKTGEYNKYLSTKNDSNAYLKLNNSSDMTLRVGGIILSGYAKRWLKFSIDIEGNKEIMISADNGIIEVNAFFAKIGSIQDYEIHFVEKL